MEVKIEITCSCGSNSMVQLFSGQKEYTCDACGAELFKAHISNGYVYILSNPSMPNLLKIGYTERDVDERVEELNSTGVPVPFEIEAIFGSANAYEDEQTIHNLLDQHRLANNREFFSIDLKQAIQCASECVGTEPSFLKNPDLAQERESVRNTPATTGYDDINNIEQVEISAPTPGYYRIVVVHAGGTSGGQSPSEQKVSILTSGDIPLSPEIAEFEQSPTNGIFLLSVECDPGAYMQVESCTDLTSGSWQTNGTFTTVANTNSVFVTSRSDVRFWRVRRETGVDQ